MHRDLAQCIFLMRADNMHRYVCLHAVHKAIYKNNHLFDSVAVKKLLNDDSLVPNAVSVFLKYVTAIGVRTFFRMHSLINYHPSALTCLIWWW